jgi:hypothetical protein
VGQAKTLGIYETVNGDIKMPLPDWVEKHKKTGYEIKHINNKYYLYKLKSKWHKTKKKPVKVSGPYIGTITPTGFKPKKTKPHSKITTKEYGATTYLTNLTKDIATILKKHL